MKKSSIFLILSAINLILVAIALVIGQSILSAVFFVLTFVWLTLAKKFMKSE